MQSLNFLVQGSSDEPYEVIFNFDGIYMNALCTCAAGQMGQACKHRFNILNQDTSNIVSNNKVEVNQVQHFFKGTLLASKLEQFKDEELQLEILKKKVGRTKKEIANIMNGL